MRREAPWFAIAAFLVRENGQYIVVMSFHRILGPRGSPGAPQRAVVGSVSSGREVPDHTGAHGHVLMKQNKEQLHTKSKFYVFNDLWGR